MKGGNIFKVERDFIGPCVVVGEEVAGLQEFSTTGASIRTSSRLRTQFKRDGYLDWKQANKILGWGRGSKSSVQRKQNQYQRIYEELCIFVMLENESGRYSSWLRRCYHSFVRLIEILRELDDLDHGEEFLAKAELLSAIYLGIER